MPNSRSQILSHVSKGRAKLLKWVACIPLSWTSGNAKRTRDWRLWPTELDWRTTSEHRCLRPVISFEEAWTSGQTDPYCTTRLCKQVLLHVPIARPHVNESNLLLQPLWSIWMLLSWAKTYIKPQQDWVLWFQKIQGGNMLERICYKRVCKIAHAGSSSCLFGSSSSVTKGSDGKCRAESGATGVHITIGYPMCVWYRRPLLGRSSPSWHHKKVIILQVQRKTKGRKVAPASAFRCFFHRPSSSSSFVLPPSGTQHGHGRWDVILATGSARWVLSQKWSKGSQDVGCVNCPPSPLQHPWWQLPNSMMTRNPNQ